jgi:hypothetical protein
MHILTLIRPVLSFAVLAGRLAENGFRPGLPAHVTPEAQAIDQATAGRIRCPGCRRRGLAFQPYCLGPRYRALGQCKACGTGMEL